MRDRLRCLRVKWIRSNTLRYSRDSVFELQGADADRQTRETDEVSGAQGVAAQPEAPAVHIEVAEEEPALDRFGIRIPGCGFL